MGLFTALNTATSGLRATQAGIDLVSQNVANAGSTGYTRRRVSTVPIVADTRTVGVRAGAIERVLDQVAQRQLRLETSGAAYTGLAASVAKAIDGLFGAPGSTGSLDGAINDFSTSLQNLLANPGDFSIRGGVLDAANALAGRIASISDGIQTLRTEAETRLGTAVDQANSLLTRIAEVNGRIMSAQGGDTASLLDQRDGMIGELSVLMDVQVTAGDRGSIRIATGSGQTLFDGTTATRLSFDGRGALNPNATYTTAVDGAGRPLRGVGTITATSPGGSTIDLVATGAFRSGEIAASIELRDRTLVQAQRQLDELAAGVATAMGGTSTAGTPVIAGAQKGFDLDLAAARGGDVLSVSFRDGDGRLKQAKVLVRDGTGPSFATPTSTNPDEPIYSLDLSLGVGAAIAGLSGQIAADTRIKTPPALSLVGASTLRVLDDGAANTSEILSLTLTSSVTGVTGNTRLPLFVDGSGNQPYTGLTANGDQLTGLAQRLKVNPAVVSDRSLLVKYTGATPSGDTARPQALLDGLTKAAMTFSPQTGLDGANAPFRGTVADFGRRVVESQAADSEAVQRLAEGQQVALASIQARYDESAAVNIDEEMANLVQLQTAYGANARVMTAVRDMLDMLMRM
jgi:flagellar hook-associated protein 1 FlgK